jgi:predicted Zn-dependent peptidase
MNNKKLKNGISVISVPMTGTKTASILVMVGTGSKYENRQNSGISHFLEHMFFKGTQKRPTAMDIASDLDALGGEYNAFTGKEYTGYWAKVGSDKTEKAMGILSDMLLSSRIDAKEVNREKGVIIEEFNMYLDNPIMRIEDVFEECLYGDTPAGWDTIGTKENILAFKRKDFTDYLNSQYSPENTTICLVGDVSRTDEAKIVKHFSSPDFAKRGKNFQEKEIVDDSQASPRAKIEFKQTDQVHLSLGCRTFGYGSEEKAVLKLMSIILGGSMSSRLFSSLRERSGLAYYVRTETESYTDAGYLTTRAGVPVDKVEKAIKIILKEYNRIKKEAVSPKELQRNKEMFRGRLVINLESSDQLANWYGRQAVMAQTLERQFGKKEKITTPEEYLKEIDKVSAGDIKDLANRIFDSAKLNLAVIGPFKEDKKLKGLLKI